MSYSGYKKLTSEESIQANLQSRMNIGKHSESSQKLLVELTEYCQWLAHTAAAEYSGQAPNEAFSPKPFNATYLWNEACNLGNNTETNGYREALRALEEAGVITLLVRKEEKTLSFIQ